MVSVNCGDMFKFKISGGSNQGKVREIGAIAAGIAYEEAMDADFVYLKSLSRQSRNQKVSRGDAEITGKVHNKIWFGFPLRSLCLCEIMGLKGVFTRGHRGTEKDKKR